MRPPEQRSVKVEGGIVRVSGDEWLEDDDHLAAEEPLEMRLAYWEQGERVEKPIAVTMRTPGDDFELAVGFLFGEGILRGREDFVEVAYCLDQNEQQNYNIVSVSLMPGVEFDMSRLDRHFYTTSSCGVCGKAALEALEITGCEVIPAGFTVDADVVKSLPDTLRDAQAVFEQTGGLHAAGLFDSDGNLLSLREDVGRHNALDKVIGEQVASGNSVLEDRIVLLSGRASFELLQKSLVARIPIVCAVGAPSSLAVELAHTFGITLIGFTRSDGFNIYTHSERILRPVVAEPEVTAAARSSD